MEPESSTTLWDKALSELSDNWERCRLFAMTNKDEDIDEDMTTQQQQSRTHQQVLPNMQPDLDIADLTVNTVVYSNATNINDAINSVYEHLDSVNSDKVNESYSDKQR